MMISIFLPADTAERSPFRKEFKTASPEELTDFITRVLVHYSISSSATVWEGWLAIHSDGVDWELSCVVTNTEAMMPTIELTAASDAWCESAKLVSIVSRDFSKIGVSLNRGLNMPVLMAPLPTWL